MYIWLTRSRNLVTVIVMLWSYISSMNETPDGTGLVGVEICLQVLIGWSLICPTIPCVRPLAMRFTTGGAIVLASEASDTLTGPSATRSYRNSQGFRKRRSHLLSFPEQQVQDELELIPNKPDRLPSTTRTSDEDRQASIVSHLTSEGGIHVSRRYEVSTEETNDKSEIRNMAFSGLVVLAASDKPNT